MKETNSNLLLVDIKNLSKKYRQKWALQDINLQIYCGERIGLIGANDGDKSIISEIIVGIRKTKAGVVWKKSELLVIGIQFQDSKYPMGITILDMIQYYLETFSIKYHYDDLENLLKTYQLDGIKKKQINSLSAGQQQILNILLAVIHKPQLIILDEVSTGLDIEVREDIFEFLEEDIVKRNVTMILLTHIMSEIEKFCEKIIFLHNVLIKEQITVKEVIEQYGTIAEYTKVKFKFYKEQDKNNNSSLMILIIDFIVFSSELPNVDDEFLLSKIKNMIVAALMIQVMITGFQIISGTIVEFRNSIIVKHFGSINIKPKTFFLTVILFGCILSLFTILITLFWTTIIFGRQFNISELLSFINLPVIGYLIFSIIISISFGVLLATFFKTQKKHMLISNALFLPMMLFSGIFLSKFKFDKNLIFKIFSYLSIFKYPSSLLMNNVANNSILSNTNFIINILVSSALPLIFIGVAIKWWKWYE
ncbi:ATP-binding cassette domain-containing protein [Spiroplasma endosymbiont of 'Nebria riversi']|uniref:ATP-binding cassette domain-containing protein n=1 Tax=Spiroplasma endosymbiont of 'Nebria riversi' TaxID=2792084 RepID=UPI001C042F1A|nr:ATP-binding cassette domain-containing protein [Spiroplasma endosymbiont of 'Nebria riversi']